MSKLLRKATRLSVQVLLLFYVVSLPVVTFAFSSHLHSQNDVRLKNEPASRPLSMKSISDDENEDNRRPHLVFPGGGIFFYWQAGVVCYIREQGYDLTSCTFSGASAGALTATLTSTGVDFYKATDLALTLAAEAGVWDRKSGLQGIWGPMIETWLDELLPHTIDGASDGRLSILVTPVPSFGKSKVNNFQDRHDLIKCNMASVHLPWFLDGSLVSTFREAPHIDGSFLAKLNDYLPEESDNRHILALDWTKDPIMAAKGGLDIVETMAPEGIWRLVEQGKSYARFLEEQGKFRCLDKVEVKAALIN